MVYTGYTHKKRVLYLNPSANKIKTDTHSHRIIINELHNRDNIASQKSKIKRNVVVGCKIISNMDNNKNNSVDRNIEV